MLRGLSRAQCALASSLLAPEARRAAREVERPAGAPARAAPGRLPGRPPRRHPPHAPEGPTMILNRRTDRPRPRQVYIGRPFEVGQPLQADSRRQPNPRHRPVPRGPRPQPCAPAE